MRLQHSAMGAWIPTALQQHAPVALASRGAEKRGGTVCAAAEKAVETAAAVGQALHATQLAAGRAGAGSAGALH